MKILANDGIAKGAAENIKNKGMFLTDVHYDKNDLNKVIGEYDVLIVRSATKVTKDVIKDGITGKLKYIIRAGVGVDNIDTEYAREKGVKVFNTPNAATNAVAELIIGEIIALARFVGEADITTKNGEWNKKLYTGTEICGSTLGIAGFGRIGMKVAEKAALLGMNVIYYDIYPKKDSPYKNVTLTELLKNSDFITMHTTATDKPVIGEAEISIMKDGAYVLNASRGNVIDEKALICALNTGKIKGVAIDVFKDEPHPDKELLDHPHVIATPHIGAATKQAQNRIGKEIVQILQKIEAGEI